MAETAREELARLRAQRSELPTQQDALQRLGTLESRVAGPLGSINSTTRRLNESLRAAQQRYQAGNNLTKDALANLRAKQAARRRSPDAGLALLSKFAEDSPAAALGAGYLAFKVDQASQSNAAIADAKDALNEAQELRSQEFAELQQNSQLETSLAELDISQQERNIDIGKTDYSTQVNATAADIQFARDASQNDLDYAEESVLQGQRDAASLRRTRATAASNERIAKIENKAAFHAEEKVLLDQIDPPLTQEQEQEQQAERNISIDNLETALTDGRRLLGLGIDDEGEKITQSSVQNLTGSSAREFINTANAVTKQISNAKANFTTEDMVDLSKETAGILLEMRENTALDEQSRLQAANALTRMQETIAQKRAAENKRNKDREDRRALLRKKYGIE